jgi:hypothetical protein
LQPQISTAPGFVENSIIYLIYASFLNKGAFIYLFPFGSLVQKIIWSRETFSLPRRPKQSDCAIRALRQNLNSLGVISGHPEVDLCLYNAANWVDCSRSSQFSTRFDNALLIWKENKIIVGPRVKLDLDLHSNEFW